MMGLRRNKVHANAFLCDSKLWNEILNLLLDLIVNK